MIKRKKLFSPLQIAFGALIGGPFAGVYALTKNCDGMEYGDRAHRVSLWGSVLSGALLLFVLFLPRAFPLFMLPVVYTFAVWHTAKKFHMPDRARPSDYYQLHSNWSVLSVGVAFFMATFLSFALLAHGLGQFGF